MHLEVPNHEAIKLRPSPPPEPRLKEEVPSSSEAPDDSLHPLVMFFLESMHAVWKSHSS